MKQREVISVITKYIASFSNSKAWNRSLFNPWQLRNKHKGKP